MLREFLGVLREFLMSCSVMMGDCGMSLLIGKMVFTLPFQWLFSVSVMVATHPLLSVPISDPLFCFSLADIMQI